MSEQMPYEIFADEDGNFCAMDTKTGEIFHLEDKEELKEDYTFEKYEPTYASSGNGEAPEYKLFPEKEESYYSKFWNMIKIW